MPPGRAALRGHCLELVEIHGADLDAAALWAAIEEVAPREAVMGAARPGLTG
ncbi:hypothetical protein Y717_31225 [Streptomyces scopuliridis RB72]|uniref:Uncharacterized protein n=1 Tax=Streptomyces scopuliridis RB72 TaxID=1440053 RepID=A0A2T7T8Z4_9ACTN|nr:hypothetical protein Y717_31225 [Streptomyces scopuliridis RB72]